MDYIFPIEIFDSIFTLAANSESLLIQTLKQASMLNNFFMYRYHMFDHNNLPTNIPLIKKIKNITYPINKNISMLNITHYECLPNKDRYNLAFLRNCTSLQTLVLPDTNLRINRRCLETLTDLRVLVLPSLVKPIKDLLIGCNKLRELYLNSYSNLLSDEFRYLTNLEILSLPCYNQSMLEHPLTTLTNLKILDMYLYNQPLHGELDNLTNLEELYLENYRVKIDNTFHTLTKLEILRVGYYPDSINKDSLKNLTKLFDLEIHLCFGSCITTDIISEINHLKNLRNITLPNLYTAEIPKNIVELLPNLYSLTFMVESDKDIERVDQIVCPITINKKRHKWFR